MFTQMRSNLKFLGSILFALVFLTGGVLTIKSAQAADVATPADFYSGDITAENVGSALANGPETINTGATQSTVTNDGVINVTGAIRAQSSNSDSSTQGPAIAQYLLIPEGSTSVEEFRIVNGTPSSLGIAEFNTNPDNTSKGFFDTTKGVLRMGVYLYSVDGLRTGDIPLKFVFKNANGTVLKDVNYTLHFDTTVAVVATNATPADFYAEAITAENVGSALANGPETINTGASQSAVVNGVITVSGAIRAKDSNSDTSTEGPAIAQYLLIPAGSTSVEEFIIVSGVPSSLGIAEFNTNPDNTSKGFFDITKGVLRMGVYLYSVDGLRTGDIPLKFVFKNANGTVLKDVNYTLRFQTTTALALLNAKTAAHLVLTNSLAIYIQGNYTAENWIVLTGFKTTGDTAIDAATTLIDVTSAQNTATTGMSGVAILAPSHGNSGGYMRPVTPAVPAKVETPDGCAAGNKFSTTTGRNCNAATPAIGKVLGAEKFNFTKFMKNGSNGSEIIELQNFLNTLGYTLVADGKFGPKTKGAVIKFQIANQLKGDGVVGALTRAILNK